MAEPDKEAGRLSEAFARVLDRHGYGFQYSLLAHIDALRRNPAQHRGPIPWGIDAVEFPVTHGPKETHIDFVLRSENQAVRLVGECKRANPSLIDWAFARVPGTFRYDVVRLEAVRVRPRSLSALSIVGASWPSDRVYQLAFPLKGEAVGDAGDSQGRTALDSAVAQVLSATSGLIDFAVEEPKDFLVPLGDEEYGGSFIPAVFTTARLWASSAELDKGDISTGRSPIAPMKQMPWLWLKQNFSKTLLPRRALRAQGGLRSRPSLGEHARQHHERVVAIVSVDGVSDFLANGEFDQICH